MHLIYDHRKEYSLKELQKQPNNYWYKALNSELLKAFKGYSVKVNILTIDRPQYEILKNMKRIQELIDIREYFKNQWVDNLWLDLQELLKIKYSEDLKSWNVVRIGDSCHISMADDCMLGDVYQCFDNIEDTYFSVPLSLPYDKQVNDIVEWIKIKIRRELEICETLMVAPLCDDDY